MNPITTILKALKAQFGLVLSILVLWITDVIPFLPDPAVFWLSGKILDLWKLGDRKAYQKAYWTGKKLKQKKEETP